MEDELQTAIALNGGYLMRADLRRMGFSDRWIAHLVRTGVLERVRHGTYVDRQSFARLTVEQRHVVIARSVLQRMGDGVVASNQTAALILGLDVHGLPLDRIHVTRLDSNSGRREAGVVHHEGLILPDQDLVVVDGLRVVSATRTVFEVALSSSTESAMVTASSALRLGLTSDEELAEQSERHSHWEGGGRARLAIRLADGRAESVGEVRSLYAMWRHGIPRPELQVEVVDHTGEGLGRVDFLWELFRHIGEFDGAKKYGHIPGGPDAHTAIVDEKVREDRIRALPYGMSRWMWAVFAPGRVAAWARGLSEALETSRRLYGRNARHLTVS